MLNQKLIERMDAAIARMEPSIYRDNLIAKRLYVASLEVEITPIQVHETLSTEIGREIPKALLNCKGKRLKKLKNPR